MKSSEKFPVTYFETSEQRRLNSASEMATPLKKWVPCPSERQWAPYGKLQSRWKCVGLLQP